MIDRFRQTALAATFAVLAAVALSACGPAGRSTRSPSPASDANRPAIVDSPLNGLPVPRTAAAERPLAIIIDNHPEARPQWGLSQADRVYESLTEGPITRYLAVFGAEPVDRVGPVRSIRTQFLNHVLETGAGLAHVGGNEDALDLMPTLHVVTLDAFHFPDAYRRIPRPRTAYEHTMFTSTTALRGLVDGRGWGEWNHVANPRWKNPAGRTERPAAQTATINFSDPRFRVRWIYRPDTNDYARELGSRPDIDAGTGDVIRTATVSVMMVRRTEGRTHIHEDTWTYDDVGTGPAWVVEDGTVIPATWHKASRSARLIFVDDKGAEIGMNRGPQWIEIIPSTVTPEFE